MFIIKRERVSVYTLTQMRESERAKWCGRKRERERYWVYYCKWWCHIIGHRSESFFHQSLFRNVVILGVGDQTSSNSSLAEFVF